MFESESPKKMMYGPSFPVDGEKDGVVEPEEMNSMVDLVRTLKEIDASPENIEAHKDGIISENTGQRIRLNNKNTKKGEG